MHKTKINFNKETRSVEVHFSSLPHSVIAKELIELISLACNYNANFSYSCKNHVFSAQCTNFIIAEKLYRSYQEYLFAK